MWILIANKCAKFHTKRLNPNENIPKSFSGQLFLKHPVQMILIVFQGHGCYFLSEIMRNLYFLVFDTKSRRSNEGRH